MKLRLLLSIIAVLGARVAAAAPECVAASVQREDVEVTGQFLFRITFRNRCDEPRVLYWCAESASGRVPLEIACPTARALASAVAEPIYTVNRQRTFQWMLPAAALVRFRDCPATDRPTRGFECTASF